MKYKATKKEVMGGYVKVIRIGYCNLQYLLRGEDPVAYTSGGDGWNADIYDFKSVAIVTGYRPFGNVEVAYDIQEKYDKLAEKVVHSGMEWSEQKKELDNLVNQFIKEAIA